MESRIGEVRKVHVVYFLSRGGQVEHPHLIKVQQTALNGLRLKDVKRWLSKLRGDDMPDSFSWSYKRKYKSSYVWQDLRDDDLITPICDSEYVLKGSEILPTRDSCRCSCDRQTPEPDRLLPEDLQSSDEQPEDSNLMFELDSPLRQKIYEDLQRCSEEVPFKELSGLKGLQNVDKCEDSGQSGEYSAKITISNKPPKSPNDTDEGVKVYKAVSSASTGPKLDAASQTGESQRLFSDGQGVSSLLDGARKVNDESLEKISAPNAPEKLPNSLLSLARNDTILSTCENTKFPPKESRQGRTRPTLASHVLKQLFRCGGLDTNDSRIHSIKALPSVKLGRRSNVNSDNSRSSTPPKKAETQTDLTKSNSVPDLQTLPEKSVFEKSDSKNFNGSFHKPIDSKRYIFVFSDFALYLREVNYTQNSSKSSHSLSSSSGEIAEKNVVGIQTPDVDCCNRNNGKPQISADSPAKVPQSPVTLWTNVKDEISPLLNPKTISKCSPKIEAPAVLSKDVETNCIKPDDRANRQNTHSKRRIRNILTK